MVTQVESLQRIFAQALRNVALERPLLARVKRAPLTSVGTSLAYLSNACPEDRISSRIDLYRGNARTHWRAALANAYPVLLAMVGHAYFDALALEYARAYPSQSGDLNGFGHGMPAFLENYEADPSFRYFADVARLEWSLHAAYFAADVTPFTPQQWLEVGADSLLSAQLVVHPACATIASHYAIADIWQAHQPGGIFPTRLDVPTWALVVRPQWQPTILVHSEASHTAFVALQRGMTLNRALDAAFTVDSRFDFANQWQAWISAAAVTGIVRSSSNPSTDKPDRAHAP
jgi:Putative DNA-binding domain